MHSRIQSFDGSESCSSRVSGSSNDGGSDNQNQLCSTLIDSTKNISLIHNSASLENLSSEYLKQSFILCEEDIENEMLVKPIDLENKMPSKLECWASPTNKNDLEQDLNASLNTPTVQLVDKPPRFKQNQTDKKSDVPSKYRRSVGRLKSCNALFTGTNPQVGTNGVKTGWDAQENGDPCESSVWHVPTRVEVVDVLPVKQADTSRVSLPPNGRFVEPFPVPKARKFRRKSQPNGFASSIPGILVDMTNTGKNAPRSCDSQTSDRGATSSTTDQILDLDVTHLFSSTKRNSSFDQSSETLPQISKSNESNCHFQERQEMEVHKQNKSARY